MGKEQVVGPETGEVASKGYWQSPQQIYDALRTTWRKYEREKFDLESFKNEEAISYFDRKKSKDEINEYDRMFHCIEEFDPKKKREDRRNIDIVRNRIYNEIMPGVMQEGFDPLDSLESQVEELERRILGNCEISEKEPHIVESLAQSNTTINNAISSHNAIKTLFDRLDQLGKFLDPSFEDSLVDLACKKKFVLESENELREYLIQSKKLSELNNTLNGEPFKKVPTLVENLRKISQETIKIQEDYDKLKKEIEAISEHYTEAVKALTKTFLLFDAQIAEIEERNKDKEPLDVPVDD